MVRRNTDSTGCFLLHRRYCFCRTARDFAPPHEGPLRLAGALGLLAPSLRVGSDSSGGCGLLSLPLPFEPPRRITSAAITSVV